MFEENLEIYCNILRKQNLSEEQIKQQEIIFLNENKKNYDLYNKNLENLKKYDYIYNKDFPQYMDLKFFITFLNNKIAILDKTNQSFYISNDYKLTTYYKDKAVLIYNHYNFNNIEKYEQETVDKSLAFGKMPIYLYYDNVNNFAEYLQLYDLTNLLETNRIVFLFGKEELYNFFLDTQSVLAEVCIGNESYSNIVDWINDIQLKRNTRYLTSVKNVEEYYKTLTKEKIFKAIKDKTVKILFITTRFSTAIQYFIRDCSIIFNNLGINNIVSMEKSDIYRHYSDDFYKVLDEFKPEIVFTIDHYKWEYDWLPKSLFFITWEQDYLPHVLSKESAKKIEQMELIFDIQYDNNQLLELGYSEKQRKNAFVPANPNLYKQYEISEEEKIRYGSDLCYYSNTGDSVVGLKDFLSYFSSWKSFNEVCKLFNILYKEIYDRAYKGEFIYTVNQCKECLIKGFNKFGSSWKSKEDISIAAEIFHEKVIKRLFREIPILWLSEKGYNIKLWGKEWVNHPKLKQYSQGVAANGEVLSKIINSSKIILGICPTLTNHPRVSEVILSGGFYLAYNVKEDCANIRKYLIENEEIIFAYDKNDLYKKIDYYLKNEDERNTVIEKGKQKIFSTLTYEVFANSVLEETKNYLMEICE